MGENRNELSPEQLKQISGGYVVSDEKENKYWMVKQDGSVVTPAPSKEKAIEYAKSYNASPTVMTREEYKKRFGRDISI